MKITILEYNEDPNTDRHNDDDDAPGNDKDSTQQQLPLHEYTLVMDAATDKNSTTNDNAATTRVLHRVCRTPNKSSNIDNQTIDWHYHQRFGSFLQKIFRNLFLPIGYPHSIDSPETYLPYQLYDGLQGLCSYWRSVVSAKAVLEATGVGNSQATPLSAALAWALRDGTGMIGGLLYSYGCSQYFDSHAKEFRLLLADVSNDVALGLDLIAPHFAPTQAAYLLALSTIGKTVCGITAGATKGHITQHFCRKRGNVADLTAKESTQETLVSLVGMVGGIWVAKVLDKITMFWTYAFFGFLTAVHVWANYQAVALLKLTTANPERTRVLFKDSIGTMAEFVVNIGFDDDSINNTIPTNLWARLPQLPTPEEIQESMLSSIQNLVAPKICVSKPAATLGRLHDCSLYYENNNYDSESPAYNYVIGYEKKGASPIVYVWLLVGATTEDELQAYVHALLLQKVLQKQSKELREKSLVIPR